jgi:hypothetical protein
LLLMLTKLGKSEVLKGSVRSFGFRKHYIINKTDFDSILFTRNERLTQIK